MSETISRLYASQDKAAAAAAELKKHRLFKASVRTSTPPGDGGTQVSVEAPFGSALQAMSIMDKHGPVVTDAPEFREDFGVLTDPAPLSHFFKLPVLTNGKALLGGLLRSDWSLSGLAGMSMLSDGPAPLSEKLHMPTLTRKGGPTFNVGLLSKNPAPLSSLFGLPTLVSDPPRR